MNNLIYLTIATVMNMLFTMNSNATMIVNTAETNSYHTEDIAGSTCENPYFIDFPLVDFQNTTSDKGDHYSNNWISPPSFFINGNDMVFYFTLEESGYLTGSMTASGSYIGVFIMQDCPNPDNPVLLNAWATSYTNTLNIPSDNPNQPQEVLLLPGDYYLIVSSYPPPQTVDFTLNLEFEFLEDCTAPIILTADNFTTESANLGWTATGNEDTWNIIYGITGFDIETEGSLLENITENPYTLSGLDAATTYDYYVQAVCNDDMVSDWAGPKSFTTECNTTTTMPFTESFESETAPPDCWSVWYTNPVPPPGNLVSHSTDDSYEGQRSFRFSSEKSGPPYNQFLRTPELGLDRDFTIRFQYKSKFGISTFSTGVSEDGVNWTWADDISASNQHSWEEYSIDVPSATKYFAIQYKGPYFRYLFIDKFVISAFYVIDYEVVTVGGQQNGVLTASTNGNVINPGDIIESGNNIEFTATPDWSYKVKEWKINGETVMDGDQPVTGTILMVNDIKEDVTVTVEFELLTDEVLSFTIGDLEQFQYPEAFRMPMDFHWQSSLSQSLYYPNEIDISRGIINALSYYTNFSEDLPGKEVMIWMGETETDNIYNNWVNPESLTQVFDGTLDFPSGENILDINLDTAYEYNGGILVIYFFRVWDTEYYGWGNRFYTTRDEDVYRTRQVNEDNPVLDPMNPAMSSNYRVDYFPTATLHFPAAVLGSIEGNVHHNGQPLEGAEVSIIGTNATTTTDSEGNYSIPSILADMYDIRFSLDGYQTHIEENFQIHPAHTHTLDIHMEEIQTYQLSGLIMGNDDVAIEGATISLSGEYFLTEYSDASGQFLFEDVPQGSYQLSISAPGYHKPDNQEIIIGDSDIDLGTIVLEEIIITPLVLAADADIENDGEVLLSWYHGESTEFRYDAGFVYWIAVTPADINTIFATKFPYEAVITHMQWYLTAEEQSHPYVTVWVFGLDENGNPDRENILYQKENVPNTDDEWMTYQFEEPVLAPNGCVLGLSAPEGIFLGTDDGGNPDWPFLTNTHYLLYTDEEGIDHYMTIEPQVVRNLNIRALGLNEGELEFKNNKAAKKASCADSGQELLVNHKAAANMNQDTQNIMPLNTKNNSGSKVLTGYNVYLDNFDTPYDFTTEKTLLIENLEKGEYTAGVQAVYTSGLSEIITATFYTDGITTGTEHFENEIITVYPNPFDDHITITNVSDRQSLFRLFNMHGQLFRELKVGPGQTQIDTSGIQEGVYTAILYPEKGQPYAWKIVKH